MTDIVERLHEAAIYADPCLDMGLLKKAADEIERLRAQAVPPGWKLVPTQVNGRDENWWYEFFDALPRWNDADHPNDRDRFDPHSVESFFPVAYAALIDAAPEPPTSVTTSEILAALEPFAAAVFNDNGDMTVDMGRATHDDYVNAYLAVRRARAPVDHLSAQGEKL